MRVIELKGFGMRVCVIIFSCWLRGIKFFGELRLWVYECFCLFSSSMFLDFMVDCKLFLWVFLCFFFGLYLGKRCYNDGLLLGRFCISIYYLINDFIKCIVFVLVWILKEIKVFFNFF